MNANEKRKEIRKEYFSSGGLIVVTILGIAGVLMTYYSEIFSVDSLDTFWDCVNNNGIMLIFGMFFFFVSVLCWVAFFRNMVLPFEKDVVYLTKEDGVLYFIDKKGKRYAWNKQKGNI